MVGRVASLVLAAALAGCGSSPAAEPTAPRARSSGTSERPLGEREVAKLLTRLSGARQLGKKRPIVLEQYPRDAFADRVRQLLLSDQPDALSAEQEAGWLLAFGLASNQGSQPAATTQEVLQEQIAGFYDAETDRIYVPHAAYDGDDEVAHLAVVAHEAHHALQHQHFDIKALRTAKTDDEALAHLAVVEGDAMVAMGAYLGARYGSPIRRTLLTITDIVNDTMPADQMQQREGHQDRKLDRALPILRERLLFPYAAGMRFVTDVYRAGGFDLVDAVYDRPPSTTTEILHPAKYLAGFQPAIIGELPQNGLTVLEDGSFGELQTRVVLQGCRPLGDATEAASGWAGDRYAVLVQPDGRIVLKWRSEWESEEDATAFAGAVGDQRCWAQGSLEAGRRLEVNRAVAARQKGTAVAFVRGLNEGEANSALTELLAVPVTRPEPLAVPVVSLPPDEELPKRRPGKVRGDVYKSRWLGLTGRIPAGMSFRIGDGDFELQIERHGAPVIGRLALSDRITTDEFNDIAFHQMALGFGRALGVGSITKRTSRTWRSPLGEAIERTFSVPGTRIQMRAILVPICAGTGSLIFVQAYANAKARAVLDGWLASFRWLDGRNLPVCRRLDPK